MGLLLSVLVVCVGVLEVIACVRHFQDGYLPLWTPHCAVTSGFAITHDRWRKLPSFDYSKNDDEKHFENLTAAKNGAVNLALQGDNVKSVDNFGKSLHSAASLQEDQQVVSEIHLQESETTFDTQKISDSLASVNEHEDNVIKLASDVHKQTVTDVFQSDIFNNLVQTEDNLETVHPEESTLRSDQDIKTQYEAPSKKTELIQQPPEPEDIPNDSLKPAEKHEDDTHETTVVDTIHHEETTHTTKDNSSGSDSRLEPQTSSSDADVIQPKDTETRLQETLDSKVKNEETPEELIQTLKKTPSPVRISPPISTPPLTPKKSKADISWPTFFPGAPVIKRPSVSFATPEALLAGEDPELHTKNDEEERVTTPPPIIKRSKESTPVPAELESRSLSPESLSEDVGQEDEEDDEEENFFRGVKEKSPTSIISGNDFSKKELELQRRKSYKLKRFNSAVETVSRDEEAEDRSFSEDKKDVSHAVKSREPKRRFKKPVKATSFEDAMLRDNRNVDVVDGGTTLKLGKEVKFVDEPTVVAEVEEILLEHEDEAPQEESTMKRNEGLKESPGQVETESEICAVPEEENQPEKNDFTEQMKSVTSEQSVFDEPEDIEMSHHEEQISALTKPIDANEEMAEEVNRATKEGVLCRATETESSGLNIEENQSHQQLVKEQMVEMKLSEVHGKTEEITSDNEVTTKLDTKQNEDVPASKQLEEVIDSSEIHSKSTETKLIDESTSKFDSKQSEENKQASKKEEEEEEEEDIEEEEVILDDAEVASKSIEVNRSEVSSTKLDTKQNEGKGQTKQVAVEELEEEEEEEIEEPVLVDTSKIHSKTVEIKSSEEGSTKTDTKQYESKGEHDKAVAEEEEEEEEEEEAEEALVMLDNSKVHSKVMEVKSNYEIPIKADSNEDDKKEETKQTDAEEEEQIVAVDSSKLHSNSTGVKSSDDISIKTMQVEEEVVVNTSKVHSKPAEESKLSDENTTKDEIATPEDQHQRQSTSVRFAEPEDDEDTYSDSTQQKTPPKEAFWLIFSGEYTKAMSKDWHSGHFCCWQCDESLTGQRYVLRDDHPYCIKCYESVFANTCEECSKIIGIDSKDLSYKDKHWHEACFLCNKCRVSLVDKQFGSKADKIYCGNCYDAQFASRCDGCGEIFRAGTKKMEYKTRQWHEKCFCCCVCKTPIGTKSFIPREQEIYCATCYEEKFATRCVKCNKIITSGGVTYKNEPWHRECFTCTHCNTSLAGQRFTSRDEKPYCADCFGELFAKRCTSCSRPITGIGGTRFISFEDRHWHNDCFICASCKTSLVGRGFITDGDDIICPECAKQKLM